MHKETKKMKGFSNEELNLILMYYANFHETKTKRGMLTKLIKQNDKEFLYWNIWKDGQSLKVNSGTVGDMGETKDVQLPKVLISPTESMDKLMNEKIKEGYRYLVKDDLTGLKITYSYKQKELEATLKKRLNVQNIIDDRLFWTGNGYCDGGGVGMGFAEIFNFVIDVPKAVNEIIEELANENLLEGIEISYLDSDNDEYITLYSSDWEH